MSNEEHRPEEMTNEEIEAVADSVPAPDEYPEGQAKELENRVGDHATAVDKAAVEAVDTSERSSHSSGAKAFDKAISGIQEAIETIGDEPSHPPDHGDTTTFLGKTYDIPIYTSVFIALGVFTVVEVLIAEVISGNIKNPVLLAIAAAKALLVVLFYMHLKEDSRIFALVLSVPIGLAIISTLFLLAIPATGGY